MHFLKESGRLSSVGPEIVYFVGRGSANFQPILDCFILNFKLKYENLENIKADRVNTVKSNVGRFFRDTGYTDLCAGLSCFDLDTVDHTLSCYLSHQGME